jgi:ferredoxin
MTADSGRQPARLAIPRHGLQKLIQALRDEDFETFGPLVRDGAVATGPIESVDQFPSGWLSEQDGGSYRLVEAGHPRFFDVTPGADGWKRYLFPPRQALFDLTEQDGSWHAEVPPTEATKRALIGVRPCELAAIQMQDRIFLRPPYADPFYRARRENLLLVVVNCLHPGDTCFCASVGTGPQAQAGYDLCLTELDESFLVEVGSPQGAALASAIGAEPASDAAQRAAEDGLAYARSHMGRHLDTKDLPQRMLANLEHPHWDEVARRCLGCGSCALVCPTCFCWDAEETLVVGDGQQGRVRVWDTCFNPNHSYHAGGGTRQTVRSRYRQWLTHKLGSWVQQFGALGCVGCGRCITWCPAGIDLTLDTKAFQLESDP